eukprot:jgi/Ulvmu1/7028/UM033_0087.1
MRAYDVVVLGATGFTGKLVCEHLAKSYQGKGVRWAMAGRNQAKLQEVRKEVAAYNQDAAQVELLAADLMDQTSLNSLAASTKVVITTVGPYAKFGKPVVQACVENGAHYCDLTGEALFIRRMMEEYHVEARNKGVKIVHSCGFDSVPGDVLSLMAAHHMRQQHDKTLGETTVLVGDTKGGVSGGTIESAVYMMQETGPLTKKMFHPFFLDPIRSDVPVKDLPDHGGSFAPAWSKAAETWAGPFIMDAHNAKIVRRSNALLSYKYGERMVYSERMGTGLLLGTVSSIFTTFAALLLVLASKVAFIRKMLPTPGNGPSRDSMENGYFSMTCYALSDEPSGGEPVRVKSFIKDGHRDGGYLSTSRMLLECALCMALQEDDLQADPYASENPGGILTPSAALGLVLHERLRNSGYELDVCDAPFPSKNKKKEG